MNDQFSLCVWDLHVHVESSSKPSRGESSHPWKQYPRWGWSGSGILFNKAACTLLETISMLKQL